MKEADITINGKQISEAESITIRVALESFHTSLVNDGLGEDDHGKAMLLAYLEHINNVRNIILN